MVAGVSDYHLVESFTRNLYGERLCVDAREYMWMRKVSLAGHLMALGAPKVTVVSAFLSRALIETTIDAKDLMMFLCRLETNGDMVLANIRDITMSHANQYRPADLVMKTKTDFYQGRYHLFLVDILFHLRARARGRLPIDDAESSTISAYTNVIMGSQPPPDAITKQLLIEIMYEVMFLNRITEARKTNAQSDTQHINQG